MADTDTVVPPAGNTELQIPKSRFDEINARLRSAEEALQIKDQLIRQVVSERQQPVQSQPSGPTAEELGIDQQTFIAAQKIAGVVVARESEQFRQWASGIANDLEATKFLVKYPGKDNYMEKIRGEQRAHNQRTGGYLDVETAYRFIRADELERQQARPANSAQVDPPAAVQSAVAQQSPAYPSAAGSRVQTTGNIVPAGGKQFHELTVEEQEARLSEGFASGQLA